jgi:hypothetical protein
MLEPVGSATPRPGEIVYGSLAVEGLAVPVVIATGRKPGPTLLVLGAQHAGELSGLGAIDRVLADLDPEALSGTLLCLPIANPLHVNPGADPAARPHAEAAHNLNRKWPGGDGDTLARLAGALWAAAVERADALLDFHCCRRVDPRFAAALEGHAPSEALAVTLGLEAIDLQTAESYAHGLLFMEAAARRNIPAVLIESHPDGFQVREAVAACAGALRRALAHLQMLPGWKPPLPRRAGRTPVFRRADRGETFKPKAAGYLGVRRWYGERVRKGDLVAVVRSPATFEVAEELRSPVDGAVGCVGDPRATGFVRPGEVAGDVKAVEWR